MNEIIEQALAEFIVPVYFLYYDGNAKRYVTYQLVDMSGVLAADNRIENYVDYYDFDIYSKTNYFDIQDSLIEKLEDIGFLWQPAKSSGDMYETDTGYYHKTLCFAIERGITNG